MWGIITVQMLNLGFPFTQAELFTLTAIAGIAAVQQIGPFITVVVVAGAGATVVVGATAKSYAKRLPELR